MTMKKYQIYGVGAALVDTELEVTDIELTRIGVDKGLMTLVDEQRQSEILEHLQGHLVTANRASGGSAANTIIASSYFGGSCFYSCKVAKDENGAFYLQDLRDSGVDSNFHDDKEHGVTGRCLVLISPDAERSMNTYLGISETLSIADLNPEAIANSQYVYLEGYLVTSDTGRAAAIQTREIAEKHNVKTALSFSDPGMVKFFKDGLGEMIGNGVDLVFCNKDEALAWANTDDLDKAITAIKKVAKAFAITLGAEGALIFDGEQTHSIPGHSVKAIDTNGAGDMFAGAFLYAITNGRSFKQAGELASLASAQVVSQYGPRLRAEQYLEILSVENQ
jgi:sugar/nucleoside kinase (ribokinase family)